MKIENLNQDVKEKVLQLINDAEPEKKADAIFQSIEMCRKQCMKT